MARKIIVPIVFIIDVACSQCECRREAMHAHRLEDGKTYRILNEKDCVKCSHPMKQHQFVRESKSKAQKMRDGEI